MLVLARKVNESITIGDDVVIKIIGVEGMQVRLGIEAPSNVRVLRQEVYEKIKEENLLSARGEAGAFIKAAGYFKAGERKD